MAYPRQTVSLELDTDVTHQCSLHHTRDDHLIGIISFQKPSLFLKWGDLEYFRRRSDEFSVMPFPDCVNAMIIDIQEVLAYLDQDVPLVPWRLLEEDCPVRIIVPAERLDYYMGIFEPTWLCSNIDIAITELRDFMDMLVH
ncbi:hypothetical protein [Acinetobacter larvae]|uniref:Uncharacterized protein n=1 Tax=Acinetobacter larvae TaxID=1789224 RepID=A0A1B2LWR3_9GAMM|nr:hypothetical protein [Acinetobacter larvae]AOA57388.1 hypothetical protein BFG52_02770 [Acinetobacter larvae]